MRADIKVWFDHPDIHPEDARNAFLAWFRRTSKDRRKPPHMILEKALIASALNDTQDKQVLPPAWKDREGNVIVVPSDGFETRWQRARKDGREPIFDKIDDFILSRRWIGRSDGPCEINPAGKKTTARRPATSTLCPLPKISGCAMIWR